MITHVYYQCNEIQKEQIVIALEGARLITQAALNRVEFPDETYLKWFGTYQTKLEVKEIYAKIYLTLQSMSMSFDCKCGDTTPIKSMHWYAYVYPFAPFEIHLCPLFWTTTPTGPSGRAGVLVHELSHFNVDGGTDDWFDAEAAVMLSYILPNIMANNSYSIEGYATDE